MPKLRTTKNNFSSKHRNNFCDRKTWYCRNITFLHKFIKTNKYFDSYFKKSNHAKVNGRLTDQSLDYQTPIGY